jgi:RNA polymerase sigma-70 factor (ECF subfamily)
VLHALEKEPDRRYQHASEVKMDVETIAASKPAVGSQPDAEPIETNPWQPPILLVGALLSLALVLGATVLPRPANWIALLLGSFGLIVAALKLAGLWPFPSPVFWRSNFTGRNLPAHRRDPDRGSMPTAGPENQTSKPVTVVRWTARVLGTLLLAFYGLFILAEGLPPIAAQPEGVQLNFAALGLMFLGFIIGWRREGSAALLIAAGWTLWHISEGRMRGNLSQTPLPVAALYAFYWWATRGRRTGVVALATVALAMVLGLGRLFVPTSVFVRGTILDARSGKPVPNVELRLLPRPAQPLEKGDAPNALADKNGQFTLYVGWYGEAKEVAISASGYKTLTTNLGPRALGQRNLSRDFQLQPTLNLAAKNPVDTGDGAVAFVPPVVIQTVPQAGAADVDPALTEIRATFSKPMQDGDWAWCKWGEENFPELTGEPKYLDDQRTCVLPVRLHPGKVYALWLNSDYHQNFKDRAGQSAVPYLLIFQTRK